jgi:hypothetical protein
MGLKGLVLQQVGLTPNATIGSWFHRASPATLQSQLLPEVVRPGALGGKLERAVRLNDIGLEYTVAELAEKGVLDDHSRAVGRMDRFSAICEASRKRLGSASGACAGSECEENGNECVLHQKHLPLERIDAVMRQSALAQRGSGRSWRLRSASFCPAVRRKSLDLAARLVRDGIREKTIRRENSSALSGVVFWPVMLPGFRRGRLLGNTIPAAARRDQPRSGQQTECGFGGMANRFLASFRSA